MRERTSDAAKPPFHRSRASEIWLQTEHLSDSERLDRLAGDAELEADLRAQGFEGEDWDFIANELARYGVAVLSGWMRDGVIHDRLAEQNVKAPHLPLSVTQDRDAREAIAMDAVADALNKFREKVLIAGVWDPTKGASLKTFFIGQCKFRYANAVRRWEKGGLDLDADELPTTETGTLEWHRVTGVEDDVIRTVTAQAILEGASNERAARALAMDACKYPNAEIAADLGMTTEAVKSLLRRERTRVQGQHGTTGGTA